MSSQRDYDAEFKDSQERKYAYDFDFDVMHGYMLRAYKSFRRPGSALELGSFKGAFTRRLIGEYAPITCVKPVTEIPHHSLKEVQKLAKMSAVMIPYSWAVGSDYAATVEVADNSYCVITNYWKERNYTGRYKLPDLEVDLYEGINDLLPEEHEQLLENLNAGNNGVDVDGSDDDERNLQDLREI